MPVLFLRGQENPLSCYCAVLPSLWGKRWGEQTWTTGSLLAQLEETQTILSLHCHFPTDLTALGAAHPVWCRLVLPLEGLGRTARLHASLPCLLLHQYISGRVCALQGKLSWEAKLILFSMLQLACLHWCGIVPNKRGEGRQEGAQAVKAQCCGELPFPHGDA